MLDLFVEPGEAAAGKAAGPRILTAFVFAAAGHVVLLAALLLARSSGAGVSPERETIRRALAEIAQETGPVPAGTSSPDAEAAARKIGDSLRFPDEEDVKKKVEIVKALLRSFFRASSEREGSYLDLSDFSLQEIQQKIDNGELRLPQGEKAFAAKSLAEGHELEIHTLSRDDEAEIFRLAGKGDKVRGAAEPRKVPPEVYYVAPEIYYRECPYERILAYGPSLFSVVQGFPDFAPALEEKKEPDKRPRAEKASGTDDFLLLTVLLMSAASASSPAAALGYEEVFRPERLAEALEALMAKSEAEQFAEFKREYLDRFHPDSSQLAEFTGRFISENLNGVIYTTDRFAEAFDSLEELYYKKPIYDAYLSYARRHPKTKTAAEFLFSLAAAYDFERRTLRLLSEVETEADEILTAWILKQGVYDHKVKAYVLKKAAEQIRAALRKSGFLNIDEALTSYRNASLAIYRYLGEGGGELRDRALYAVAATYWEDGQINRAFETWRRIDPAYETPEFSYIKNYLNATCRDLALACDHITKFLSRRAGTANQVLLRRQLRFHKWTTRAKAWAEPKNERHQLT